MQLKLKVLNAQKEFPGEVAVEADPASDSVDALKAAIEDRLQKVVKSIVFKGKTLKGEP